MSGETILVTRPKGDEKILTDLLHAHGYRVIHEPLTNIVLDHTQRPWLEKALFDEPDACILTSRHAVQALSLLTDMRDMFLICVGESTARVAETNGFTRLSVAGGHVDSLIDHVTASYDDDARFLYLSGEHVRADLPQILATSGMQVQRMVLYDAVAATQLSDTLIEQLKRQQIDGVTLLSTRTAELFVNLVRTLGIHHCVSHLHGFCLSEAIARPLRSQPWKQLHVSDEPTLASMLECVDNTF
jgi:uroporphyrinogen-III synthase